MNENDRESPLLKLILYVALAVIIIWILKYILPENVLALFQSIWDFIKNTYLP